MSSAQLEKPVGIRQLKEESAARTEIEGLRNLQGIGKGLPS